MPDHTAASALGALAIIPILAGLVLLVLAVIAPLILLGIYYRAGRMVDGQAELLAEIQALRRQLAQPAAADPAVAQSAYRWPK